MFFHLLIIISFSFARSSQSKEWRNSALAFVKKAPCIVKRFFYWSVFLGMLKALSNLTQWRGISLRRRQLRTFYVETSHRTELCNWFSGSRIAISLFKSILVFFLTHAKDDMLDSLHYLLDPPSKFLNKKNNTFSMFKSLSYIFDSTLEILALILSEISSEPTAF